MTLVKQSIPTMTLVTQANQINLSNNVPLSPDLPVRQDYQHKQAWPVSHLALLSQGLLTLSLAIATGTGLAQTGILEVPVSGTASVIYGLSK